MASGNDHQLPANAGRIAGRARSRWRFVFAFGVAWAAWTTTALAQDGSAITTGFAPEPNGAVNAVMVEADGKIWIGGSFSGVAGASHPNLARLMPDGTNDISFIGSMAAPVRAIARDVNGYLLVGAEGSDTSALRRLNQYNQFDPTFPGFPNGAVHVITVQPDGKILIGGEFTEVNGVARSRIARLNADGTLDTSFNASADGPVYSIVVQRSWRIVFGGLFTQVNGVTRSNLARVDAFGILDASFTSAANGTVRRMVSQPDGKLLVAGEFGSVAFSGRRGLARLLADGLTDNSFTGPPPNAPVFALHQLADGRIMIAGVFTSVGGAARQGLARLNLDGTADLSFKADTLGSGQVVQALAGQYDGKIIVGGTVGQVGGVARNNLARVFIDGTTDANQAPSVTIGATVRSIAAAPSGVATIGGTFSAVNSSSRCGFARLSADGKLDTSMLPQPGPTGTMQVNATAVQADGKRILAGSFTTVDGVTRNNIARLNADWTLDSGFSPSLSAAANAVLVQPDGKIIVGGAFTTVNATTRNRICRLDDKGVLEGSFTPSFNAPVNALAIQLDGKIWVGGDFTGTVARLSASGAVEFTLAGASGSVKALAIQADGKILVGGSLTSGPGQFLFRLNADGTRDVTFGQGVGGPVHSIQVQTDGKIVVGGEFTSTIGPGTLRIARLNGDGSMDTTWSSQLNNTVNTVSPMPDGSVWAGGVFTSNASTPGNGIVRLRNGAAIQSFSTYLPAQLIGWYRGGAGAEADWVRFELSLDGTNWTALQSVDPPYRVGSYWSANCYPGTMPLGHFFIRARAFMTGGGKNGSVQESVQWFGLPMDPQPTQSIHDMGADGEVVALALQADGKVLAGGVFTQIAGVPRAGLARFNSDATLDATFNPLFDNVVRAVAIQPDGKILAGGFFSTVNGDARSRICRLLADGTLDPAFASVTLTEPVRCIAVQPDGKILIGGDFVTVNGADHWRIARLNGDGTPDASFQAGVGLDATAMNGEHLLALALQPDRKILAGGGFHMPDGTRRNLVRFHPDGTLDLSFTASLMDAVMTIALRPDGKIWVNGAEDTGGANFVQPVLLNPDGSLAPHPLDVQSAQVIQTTGDGSVVVAGSFGMIAGSDHWPYVKFALDGVEDSGFHPPGIDLTGQGSSMLIHPDGSLWLGGDFFGYGIGDGHLIRISAPNSAVDADAVPDLVGSNVVNVAIMQPDGRVLIGGEFTAHGSNASATQLARLNADGSLDESFLPEPSGEVKALAQQADGKVIVAGSFSEVGIEPRANLARVNADGALDAGFAATANNIVYAVVMQSDGKIVIGGDFTSVSGTPRGHIARLNADGTLDAAFTTEIDGPVYALALQPDGKILAGGVFLDVSGTTRSKIARLNANGTVDGGFNPSADGNVFTLCVLPDGKILVGGYFSNIGGLNHPYLARLNADGTGDELFFGQPNDGVDAVAVQTDGKIVLGGEFDRAYGIPRKRIVRLNADGSLDDGFIANVTGSWVFTLAMQADGRTWAGGTFSDVGGQPREHFARLNNPDAATQSLTVSGNGQVVTWNRGGSSPEVSRVTMDISLNGGTTWTPLGNAARVLGTSNWQLAGLSLPQGQTFTIRALGVQAQGVGGNSMYQAVGVFYLQPAGPDIVIEGPNGIPLADAAAPLDWGQVMLGTPAARTVVIRNIGAQPLNLGTFNLDGTDSASFGFTPPVSFIIPPNQSVPFTLSFSATTYGTRSAALHIDSNDPDEHPFDLNLSALGTSELHEWRKLWFGSPFEAPGSADLDDADHDGIVNLIEFATGTNPTLLSDSLTSFEKTDGTIQYTYWRNSEVLGEVSIVIEWTDDLAAGPWSTSGVVEEILLQSGPYDWMRATVPAGASGHRFVRQRVTRN